MRGAPAAPCAVPGVAAVSAVSGAVAVAAGAARARVAPRQQIRAVAVDAGGELGVEQQVAGRVVLREVRQRTPADDEVAVGGGLRVALRRRRQRVRLVVGLQQRRRARALYTASRAGPRKRGLAVGELLGPYVERVVEGAPVGDRRRCGRGAPRRSWRARAALAASRPAAQGGRRQRAARGRSGRVNAHGQLHACARLAEQLLRGA